MKVGFIGLGRMGRGMARRVLGGGHDLLVYNRSPGKTSELVADGARAATSVAEVCAGREIVITMLADDDALNEVALGPGGIKESLPDGAIHLTMGTHGVAAVRELGLAHADAGQILVAAHVLGRPDLAEAGTLGIVAAGDPAAIRRCEPVLSVIGRPPFEAGPNPENATTVKLANNFVLGCAIEAMGEAFSLVRKHGVSPDVLYDVMTDALFAAPAYKVYGRIIRDEDYDQVGFTAELGLKDANLILAAGDRARVPLPSANTYRDRLLGAIANGDGDRDWAVIAREQGRASGLD